MLFPLGAVVITAHAHEVLNPADMPVALARHAAGDWGDLDPFDRQENDRSVVAGGRLLSAYTDRSGTRFWIITEADRSVTTVLLPEDY